MEKCLGGRGELVGRVSAVGRVEAVDELGAAGEELGDLATVVRARGLGRGADRLGDGGR